MSVVIAFLLFLTSPVIIVLLLFLILLAILGGGRAVETFFVVCFLSTIAGCTVLMWSLPAPAQTASRSFYDRGSFAGSSVTHGRQTDYFDRRGSFAGSSFGQGTP